MKQRNRVKKNESQKQKLKSSLLPSYCNKRVQEGNAKMKKKMKRERKKEEERERKKKRKKKRKKERKRQNLEGKKATTNKGWIKPAYQVLKRFQNVKTQT